MNDMSRDPRRTVVFDFGGVMFQWKPLELLQEVVPELAPDEAGARELAPRIFQGFVPGSDWAHFDLGLIEPQPLAQRIAARIGAAEHQVRRVIDAIPGHLQPLPDSVALFHRLKAAGHRMVFLSNMPAPYAEHLEREHGFLAGFDDGIFSGRVQLIKPDAAIFALAESSFGLEPRHTVFIDDHAGNIDAAASRGWQTVHFAGAGAAGAALGSAGWL
jgi:putative hydrolase of the HAD superfamily